jgi:hypothetical protein
LFPKAPNDNFGRRKSHHRRDLFRAAFNDAGDLIGEYQTRKAAMLAMPDAELLGEFTETLGAVS